MPPGRRDPAYLWDMLEAARTLHGFLAGVAWRDYQQNRMMQSAVERKLELIGEAAGRVSTAFREAHPEIPWTSLISLRNVLAHEYGEIKQERIWQVATKRVPELLAKLPPLIPPAPAETAGKKD